ncbi:MAG TPA: hypothetical protein PK079_24220 [Leptospiraceae bacterium]|nr:hypothetical protein [Leptospiraceae bacterium]HMW07093.1 hypothetical protein [Leptospiraceae bacterium]HMX31767.1 hypothetical protein [Leptospiraceae bacterium]HMY32590.1 hypothetical protein [Leptospiraceae bacterium]HMZ63876.1 hypothetical protein [Leptospiraceae bacterium]
MKLADYFKISLKKPEITESIAQVLDKKNKLKSQIETCFSRLESIEICNSNSKSADAMILSNYLIVDLTNLILIYLNQPTLLSSDKWQDKTKTFPEELSSIFSEHNSILNSSYETDEERSEKIESSLSDILLASEKFIFKKNKADFQNPIDDYKKRSAVQFILSVIILIVAINTGIKLFNKYKAVKEDTAKIYFMNTANPAPNPNNTITAKVIPSENWVEANFVLPNPVDIKEIKVELIHQVFTRFQLKDLKFLDENKKVLRERNFQLNNLGMVENSEKNEICCTEELKPGKLIPGKYMELETTSSSPSFYVKMEESKSVKEIVLTYRYIKNTNKFPD